MAKFRAFLLGTKFIGGKGGDAARHHLVKCVVCLELCFFSYGQPRVILKLGQYP